MTSSTSATSDTQLTIEDLSTVHDALTTVAHKFLTFGSKISVPHHILAEIEKSNYDFNEKLYKVLEYRLKQLPLLTWHDIVSALRSPAIQYQTLALEIESQYIPCSSSQSQLASAQSSAPIDPDSGPAQAMQHQYFPNQPQCYIPNTIPSPHQWLPQHGMYPPPPHPQMHPLPPQPHMHPQPSYPQYPPTLQPQMHQPSPHPQMYPPPAHLQIHPPHPQAHIHPLPSHPQYPPSLQPQMYPSPPQPQYPYSGTSQSFINPKLSFGPPVIFSQPITGRARKRSSFEQVNVSSQAGSISAQPRSFGLYSWQSQPLMAAPLSVKRHCVQPDPSPPLPYSDSGSRALFNQFVEYVKTLYRRSPVEKRTEVLKLKTPGKMFINLAFIDRKTEGLRTEYDEITEAMVRDGNVDVIRGRKCPIDMNAIAANLPEEALEKMILVEGAPGVGKSTFAWEFCRRWERGEIAQQYDLVLLLRLRDDRISKAKCLKDLIYHHSEKVREVVVSELESCLGVNVLLLLEGYDELPDKCRHHSSLFLELINGQVLPLATVLITSRPWATCDVRWKFGHRIFQHIEVLGFTNEQIREYIRSALSEEEALDLERKLEKQSTVKMCMYIPLNCAIVVTVYLENKANGVALPTTLCEFYVAVSCAILLRYLRAINISFKPFENLDNLPAAVKNKYSFLCELAYDSIAGAGHQVKLIFTDLPEDFDGLGFMDSVFELYETRKTVASHNFLHLTFQEFLAAVHISNMEAEQRVEHFKRHREGRLRVVLRFLAGITKLKDFSTPSSFTGLLDQPTKCGYTAIDYTIRPDVCTWVYEALGKEIIRTTFREDVTMEFAGDHLSDSAALGYCITHSCCKWVLSISGRVDDKEVDILVDEIKTSDSTGGVVVGLRGGFDEEINTFRGLSVSLTKLKSIFTGLHIQLSELALELPGRCRQISWPDLSSLRSLTIDTTTHKKSETMNWELDYLLPQLSLSSLTLWLCLSFLSFEDSKAVANYVTNTSTLKYLHILVYCPLSGMDEIFAAVEERELRPNFTLEILDENLFGDDAEYLATYIRTTTLFKLVFSYLKFSAFDALQVARALREVPDLIANKLYLDVLGASDFPYTIELSEYFDHIGGQEYINMNEHNVSFSFLLPDSTTVKWELYVEGGIDDVGLQHMAEALRNKPSIKTLMLFNFKVTDVGTKALVEVLNFNNILELELSNTEISNFGTGALANAIWSNTSLKKLSLCENNVGDVGAIALAQALHSNSSLEVLDLSCNCIGDGGAKAFAEALHHNSTLTHLNLSCNEDIGEEGVHHLIQALTVNDSISENGLTLDRE